VSDAERESQVPQPLTMYTTTWCAFCRRLKSQLAAVGIEITEVNIEEDPAAAEFVMSVNGGCQTVPTVVFPDGSALTNPSAVMVKQRLGELAGVR
jgi:mycoredoxin